MLVEITLPARIIEIGTEEEEELQNLFLAYGKARRICYSLRQKYEIKGKMDKAKKYVIAIGKMYLYSYLSP